MSGHTKEPWVVFPRNSEIYIGIGEETGDGIADAGFGLWRDGPERKANATRIVNCVNAMAGIDDPAQHIADFNEMKKHVQSAISAADAHGKLEGKGPSVWFMGFDTDKARVLLSRMGDA